MSPSSASPPRVAVVGGGPAGLRAAEVLASRGFRVDLFDAKPSVGRKFLVAGRGGLNLTHGEPLADFISRYRNGPGAPPDFWDRCLRAFTPDDLRAWAAGLGIETFRQTTGRVYPREMKAAPLLRRWLQRLRDLGVAFHMNHRLLDLDPAAARATFETPHGPVEIAPDHLFLALGGASWPITGSTGSWTALLTRLGLAVRPLVPANCGWETPWPRAFLEAVEGLPLKNITVSTASRTLAGELLVTRYGLEGGCLYALGAELRGQADPVLYLDLKPTSTPAQLLERLQGRQPAGRAALARAWKLSPVATAILHHLLPSDDLLPAGLRIATLAHSLKKVPILLLRPRPIDEAISSAGGLSWTELQPDLSLTRFPRLHAVGEMIDWEAPTGGYLMQGCFATATLAAGIPLR